MEVLESHNRKTKKKSKGDVRPPSYTKRGRKKGRKRKIAPLKQVWIITKIGRMRRRDEGNREAKESSYDGVQGLRRTKKSARFARRIVFDYVLIVVGKTRLGTRIINLKEIKTVNKGGEIRHILL